MKFTDLASPWYSTSSALFWVTVVLVVIAIPGLIFGILTWRSAVVRRRILCSVISQTPLLAAPQTMRDDLEVRYRSERLEDPYVITLEFVNVGRAPIHSNSFDGKRRLTLELNAPILKVLAVGHEPASAPTPTISSNDSEIELSPELIVRGERIRAALLTEGRPRNVGLSLNPFGDVDVQVRDREAWQRQRSRRFRVGSISAAAALIIGSTLLVILARPGIPPPTVYHLNAVTETVWNKAGAPTYAIYGNVGAPGPVIPFMKQVDVACKVYKPNDVSAEPGGYLYEIVDSPWNEAYYAPANAFLNGDNPNGPYIHNYDARVSTCPPV